MRILSGNGVQAGLWDISEIAGEENRQGFMNDEIRFIF